MAGEERMMDHHRDVARETLAEASTQIGKLGCRTRSLTVIMGKRHPRRVERPEGKRRLINQAGTTVEVFMGDDKGWKLGLVTKSVACGIRDTEELYEVQLLQGQHHGQVLRDVNREALRISVIQVLPDIEAPIPKEIETSTVKQEDAVPTKLLQKSCHCISNSENVVKTEIIKEEQLEDEIQT